MSDEKQPVQEVFRLDHFLKISGIADTGGQAKVLIQGGKVLVNGEQETRRRRKLVKGDVVRFEDQDYPVDEVPTEGEPEA